MELFSKIVYMISRIIYSQLSNAVAHFPAVALLGPCQVGKTTLALEIGRSHNALCLDLESEQDRAKFAQPELYLSDHQDRYCRAAVSLLLATIHGSRK
jgi:uncharacterized protein